MKINNLVVIIFFIFFSVNTVAEKSGDPKNGKNISQTCAACHGADGNSVNPVWPKLAGQHTSYTVKQLNEFKAGKRIEPQMTGITDNLSKSDILDIASYYSTKKSITGSTDPNMLKLGQEIYRVGVAKKSIPSCMACHGPAGEGNPGAKYPALAGQYATYTAKQLKAFRARERSNDINKVMRNISSAMTDEQIQAVSEYIQGLY